MLLLQKIVQVMGESESDDPEEKTVFVLTSSSLQKWCLIKDEPDKMFYNCDVETIVKEAFVKHVWVSLGLFYVCVILFSLC